MVFQRDGCKPIANPTLKQLQRSLGQMKSSFASLTMDDDSYFQVAGGPGLFLLEYRDDQGRHYRASQEEVVVPFDDGTSLVFSGGEVSMNRHEWFLGRQVVEVFASAIEHQALPDWVKLVLLDGEYQPRYLSNDGSA